LVTARPKIPYPDGLDQREKQEWYKNWSKTEEGRLYWESWWHNKDCRHFVFAINKDGTFRIEDVPSGKYDLTVYIEELQPASGKPPREIAYFGDVINVPEIPGGRSDEPLDIGALELKLVKEESPGQADVQVEGGIGEKLGKTVLTYGPVIEMTIPNYETRTSNQETIYNWFDLDRGVLKKMEISDLRNPVDWRIENGADITYHSESQDLDGWDMVMKKYGGRETNYFWNSEAIELLHVLMNAPPEQVSTIKLSEDQISNTSYLIKTREGQFGILQIVGFSDNPKGIKIRYKMVQKTTSENPVVQVEGESVSFAQECARRIMEAFHQEQPKQDYTNYITESLIYHIDSNDLTPEKKERQIKSIIESIKERFDPNLGHNLAIAGFSDRMIVVDIYNKEKKTDVQVEVLTDKPPIVLDLDSGKVMRLDKDWPDEYDVGWDNDAGGSLFAKPDGPVRMLPIVGAKNFDDAKIIATSGGVLNTRTSMRYPSIQAAIDAASDGDTIVVAAKYYKSETVDFKVKAITGRSGYGVPAEQSKYIWIKTSQGNIAVVEVSDFDENRAEIRWQIIQQPTVKTNVQVEQKKEEQEQLQGQAVICAVDDKATLRSGLTVELLGVTRVPVRDQPWWKPDRSPLEPMFEWAGFDPSLDPNWEKFDYYAVVIRLTDMPSDKIGWMDWRFSDANGYPISADFYPSPERVGNKYMVAKAARFSNGVETTTVLVGIVSGEWQTLFAGSHYGIYEKGGNSVYVSTPEIGGGPGLVGPDEKGIHIAVTYNITDRDFRVVAVDKEGKVYVSRRSGSGGGKNLRRTTASFPDLTPQQLQEYRFQVRPYEWVEFKDIPLRPGSEAVALAEQRKARRQEELEKWLGEGQTRQIREQIAVLRDTYDIHEPDNSQVSGISAMQELVRIGSPAVPELVAELRRCERRLTKSLIAFTLRAIGDSQVVPALIELLGQSKYSGELGIYVKDDRLANFMLNNQHRSPDESDRQAKAIIIGCPVIEITAALEKITGHSEGHEHFGHKATAELGPDAPHEQWQQRVQQIVQETAERWQKWWDQHKDEFISR
jgi:hypothetical protein